MGLLVDGVCRLSAVLVDCLWLLCGGGVVVIGCAGFGGGCSNMFEVSAAPGEGVDEMGEKLGVHVAPKPAYLAGALPIPAPTPIATAVANYVGESGAIPQGCTSQRPGSFAPRTRDVAIG